MRHHHSYIPAFSLFLMLPPPPRSTLFPYTTLFRSSMLVRMYLRWAERKAISASVLDEMPGEEDRKSTRLNSSHSSISYAVFCLKKKKSTLASDLSAATVHP